MGARRRIALFIPSLSGGGAERVIVNLAVGLAAAEFDVDLVLCRSEGAYVSQVPPQVRIVDLRADRVLGSLPALVSYLRRERPFVLLAALNHANIVALWARYLARVPTKVIVSVHATLSSASRRASGMKDRVMPVLMRMFFPWADAVIAVSEGVARDVVRITGLPMERVHVIHNPIYSPELNRLAMEVPSHPWLESNQPPVVLGVGRLTAPKDFATLVQAFARVAAVTDARLIILGEGEDRSELENLVDELALRNRVSLPGFVENPYGYMARAAVFVLSSAWEGFGNVLVEAMAVGTPVVSTDCEHGPREILADGVYGRLVPVGDVEALADAILQELSFATPRRGLQERAKEFSLEKVTQQYIGVMSSWFH